MQEDTYWSNIFRLKTKKEEGIFSVLKRIPVFQDLSSKELKALERILHRRTYHKDEIVFNEDEPGVGMYIVEAGKVHVTLGQEKKLLAVLSTGDFFGEMALLLEAPRTATVTAVEPCKLLGFFQPDLFNLLETHPRTGNKILQRLAQMIAIRLRQTTIENRHLKLKINEFEEAAKKRKKV